MDFDYKIYVWKFSLWNDPSFLSTIIIGKVVLCDSEAGINETDETLQPEYGMSTPTRTTSPVRHGKINAIDRFQTKRHATHAMYCSSKTMTTPPAEGEVQLQAARTWKVIWLSVPNATRFVGYTQSMRVTLQRT